MQPSSQNIPQRWNLPFQKINRKFDFRSACNKIPKTTAFTFFLYFNFSKILGISYIKKKALIFLYLGRIYLFKVEFNLAKRNLFNFSVLQKRARQNKKS